MPTNQTSVKPLEYAKETILGATLALEQRFGCTPRLDLATTLNSSFQVFPNRNPANERLVKYFCWGVNGRVNDTEMLSSARPVLGTNMAPYAMRPFRAVPLENDLSAEEMSDYAMRQVRPINGTPYALYYLKKLVFPQSQVQYVRTDPVTGSITSYSLDYANLNPTPPVSDDNGIISDVSDQVSVVIPATMTITGREVLESMAVIDGGDPRFAIASEFGFVSASSEMVTATNFNNTPFTYEEAIFAQMIDHYTFTGASFTNTTTVFSRTMSFSAKNLINQS